MFDVVNEERQRRAVMLGRCQVCDDRLPLYHGPSVGYTKPIGWLPKATLAHESGGHLEDGTPVTVEPLCCEPCATWVSEHCCFLARSGTPGVVRVDRWSRILQYVDPSAAPPNKQRGTLDSDEMAKLGRVARRQNPPGLVGFVKIALRKFVDDG